MGSHSMPTCTKKHTNRHHHTHTLSKTYISMEEFNVFTGEWLAATQHISKSLIAAGSHATRPLC